MTWIALIVGYSIILTGGLGLAMYLLGKLAEWLWKWTGYWPLMLRAAHRVATDARKRRKS